MATVLDVPIRFDVGDGVTHAPMVDVLVAGQPTRLILDTGSTDHVLTLELVRAAGLRYEPGEPGTDHAGASVDSWFVGDVAIAIDDVGFELRDAVAIRGPAPFAGWGVGGFLSPQHLHPTARAVIDLDADRLILVDGPDDAIDDWLRDRRPDLLFLGLERDADEATPVVSAAIEPFAPVATMLNTGGRGTEFAVAAVPDLVGDRAGRHGQGRRRRSGARHGRRGPRPSSRRRAAAGPTTPHPGRDRHDARSRRDGRPARHGPGGRR